MSTSKLLDSEPDARDHAAHRTHRIKLAALTSIASKVVTIALQVFALPLALHALGVAKFGVYEMLGATLSWVTMAQVGIGPGLTLGISTSVAKGDTSAQSRYFSSALYMVGTVVAALCLVLLMCIWVLPVAALFGGKINPSVTPELRLDMTCLVIFLLTRIILSVFDAAQAGYQEQYICNLWATLGNILSLIALIFATRIHPTILTIIVAVNALPIIADVFNAARLIGWSHPALKPKLANFDWVLGKSLLGNGVAFSTVVASSYLMYSCSVLLIGRMHGPQSAATFAVLQQACNTALGTVVMFVQPLWPALNDAKSRSDRGWAVRASSKVTLFSMAYALAVGLVMAVFGHEIFKIWYHSRIDITEPLQICFGLYFVLAVWEYVHYNILIGMNNLLVPAVLMAVRSVVMLAMAPFLIDRFGDVGLAAALCLAQVLLSTWIFPLLVKRALSPTGFGLNLTAAT